MDSMIIQIENIITKSNEERELSPSGCSYVSMKTHDDIMKLLNRPFVKQYMESEHCYLVEIKSWGRYVQVDFILDGSNITDTIHDFYDKVFQTEHFKRLETIHDIING